MEKKQLTTAQLFAHFGIPDFTNVFKQCKRSTTFDTQRDLESESTHYQKYLQQLYDYMQAHPTAKLDIKYDVKRDYMSEDDMVAWRGEREYSKSTFRETTMTVTVDGKIMGSVYLRGGWDVGVSGFKIS